MKKKNILALVAIAITITAIFTPLVPTAFADHTSDPDDWYKTIEGVLDDDYYSLYPFKEAPDNAHISVGLSQYGELIDASHGGQVGDVATGLNYSDARDPFANENIPDIYWLQGWFADIRYIHRVYGARHVWAMATFADLVDSGGDWLTGHTDPYGPPHGGRKTNTFATTEPMEIIYDGPRRFVAVCTNHLYDTILGVSFPLVDVKFTIIFEKVKKEVIILKDIKLTIDQKILEAPIDVQFSNRAEWDLGPSPDWKSYAHFYHQQFETCYGSNWTLAKTILREHRYINQSWQGNELDLDAVTLSEPAYTETPDDPAYDVPVVVRSEYVYINNEWLTPDTDYQINYNTGFITFTDTYPPLTKIEVFYKLYKYDTPFEGDTPLGDPLETPHLYDVAQIISRDLEYVGWAAFWPVLSDYSVDAWDRALEPLIAVDEPDMLPVPFGEPDIPFVVGEWDFMLDLDTSTEEWGEQFRGVSVYGVTDYNDAEDEQMDGPTSNIIDREVQYQLDEVFVPWALLDGVHKEYRAWVEWDTGGSWTSDHRPVVDVSDNDWNQYAVFSERVYDYTSDVLLNRYEGDYTFFVDSNGYAHISGLPNGHNIKILYHTWPNVQETYNTGYTTVFNQTVTNQSSIAVPYDTFNFAWSDNIGVDYTYEIEFDSMTVNANATQNFTVSYADDFPWTETDFKVFLGETYRSAYFEFWNIQPEPIDLTYASFGWDPDNITKTVTAAHDQSVIWPLDDETVHVEYLIPNGYSLVTVTNVYDNDTQENNLTVTLQAGVDVSWNTKLMGRYEWTVVGRDAASVDSAGAALVTAAFKNKQVEIGLAGSDMFNPVIANQMPWVMAKMEDGDIWPDYIDDIGRSGVRDDWCRAGTISGDEWPIATSNMIGVGGPLANGLAYYGNDFTNAYYGLAETYLGKVEPYTPLPKYQNQIMSTTCWDKQSPDHLYQSDSLTGYAVVSSYLDINGTEIFLIWGNWGRDTFYATKWFHEEGIYQLQEAPPHLTDIILEIKYQSTTEGYKPISTQIVESLGTISETGWDHTYLKGDIHPDP